MWAFPLLALLLLVITTGLAVMLRRARKAAAHLQAGREALEDRLARLQSVAARNAAILNNAMDGFFVLGEDYRFVEVNEAFCRMTGYSTAELLRMTMTDLEVNSPVQDGGDASSWRTGLHHFATSHRHKDGHIVQFESCVVVLREGTEKILVGFARDVTERYRAEQALRASEAQYRNLVETSRDLIWSVNLKGRWMFVNKAATSIYGYQPEEMVGRTFESFVAPEHAERFLSLCEECKSGRAVQAFETEHVRKDGSRVQLSMSAIAVRDGHNNIIGYTGTATDISARMDAEHRLRAANVRFTSLVAGMPLGYVVWSSDYRIQEWNPAASAIFGYAAEDVVSQPVTDLIVPPEEQAAFRQMCQSLLDGEACRGTVLVNRKQAGEKIKCEWFNTALPDQRGGVQSVAALVRDVSERERLETQLRQSQKLESLGVLAGGVAHDFNNLLVGIMGNASLAMEQIQADSPLRVLLERVVNAGRRATALTQRMLAYAGRATCDVQVMDLNGVVHEMADFATAAVPKTVSLQIDTADDLPLIKADSGQIQQVIMNLLINAAEAIDESGGEVGVSTWAEDLDARRLATEFSDDGLVPGRYVCLEVRDTGHGMSAETLSRIFDPFFSTKFAGRGLGLSAILGIVRAHRGAVSVASKVGKGTVFRMWVPVVVAAAKADADRRRGAGVPRGSTVLVVDDEDEIRDVVETILSSRGIRVLTAADGTTGIDLFRNHADDIDIVLLDMNMPGMSGETVFEELRAISPKVKVMISTGYSEQETAPHFSGASLAGFVPKPYTASSLIDKIGAALASN